MAKNDFSDITDPQLLSLIKGGNQLAFNQLYNRYWKRLFFYAFNILNDKWLAEDVLHEVFTSIWLKKEKLKVSNLESYLFVAVKNKSISLLKKVKFTELDEYIIDTISTSPQVEDDYKLQDLKSVIENAASSLPERCREIFYMSRYEDYSNSEIANHFQISHRTVENQLSIALKHIRHILSNAIGFLLFFGLF